MTAIRKKVMGCIDDLPDNRLEALMPILALLLDDTIILETDLSEDEKNIVCQGRQEYKKGDFIAMPLN